MGEQFTTDEVNIMSYEIKQKLEKKKEFTEEYLEEEYEEIRNTVLEEIKEYEEILKKLQTLYNDARDKELEEYIQYRKKDGGKIGK